MLSHLHFPPSTFCATLHFKISTSPPQTQMSPPTWIRSTSAVMSLTLIGRPSWLVSRRLNSLIILSVKGSRQDKVRQPKTFAWMRDATETGPTGAGVEATKMTVHTGLDDGLRQNKKKRRVPRQDHQPSRSHSNFGGGGLYRFRT